MPLDFLKNSDYYFGIYRCWRMIIPVSLTFPQNVNLVNLGIYWVNIKPYIICFCNN